MDPTTSRLPNATPGMAHGIEREDIDAAAAASPARACQICHHTDWLLCAVGCGDLACFGYLDTAW